MYNVVNKRIAETSWRIQLAWIAEMLSAWPTIASAEQIIFWFNMP